MKLKEKWKLLPAWQKVLIILRDLTLYAVLFSAIPHISGIFDNSILVLICLPVSAISQAALSWKQDRKTAVFFLLSAIFVFVMYVVSAV